MIKILCGSNSYRLQERKKETVQQFIDEHGDHAVEQFDSSATEPDQVLASLKSLPFLVSRKLVILNDLSGIKTAEDIQGLLDSVIDEVDLLIYLTSVDRRSAVYKTLKKQPGFEEVNDLDEHQVVEWLVSQAKELNAQLSRSDASYLVEHVGRDQVRLMNELNKLAAYTPNITRSSIQLLSAKSLRSNSFDMLDAAFSGNGQRAVQYYKEQRLMGVEPQLIIGALIWQIRVILALKYSKLDIQQTARESKFSPYSLRKSSKLADSISYRQAKELVRSILDLDVSIKSKSIDVDQAILAELLKISAL